MRKFGLFVHIISSVGWLGAVVCFLVLAIAGRANPDAHIVAAAYLAMDLIAQFVIVPFALASLLTGLVQSLWTPWGLLQHYWVLAKLVLTVVATVVLLLQLKHIHGIAGAATAGTVPEHLAWPRTDLVLHAAGGLVVLLVTSTLAVYKPRGVVPHHARNVL
ncbi:MAG TPA: hypothetical protein VGY57_12015 [Vicinamibacterales bacterium]|nr:hypothetical protein [Vicinamibacterales bacterium]